MKKFVVTFLVALLPASSAQAAGQQMEADESEREKYAELLMRCKRPLYLHQYDTEKQEFNFEFKLTGEPVVLFYLPLISEAAVRIYCDGPAEDKEAIGVVNVFERKDFFAVVYIDDISKKKTCAVEVAPKQPIFLKVCAQ